MASTNRFTFTPAERKALSTLVQEYRDIVAAMRADVASLWRRLLGSVQPVLRSEEDVDWFLAVLVDKLVERELVGAEGWGKDEGARVTVLELLARYCITDVRQEIARHLPAAARN